MFETTLQFLQKVILWHPEDKTRFLVLHRAEHLRLYPSTWDLPGGHVENAESHFISLQREVKEECGAWVTSMTPIYVYTRTDTQFGRYNLFIGYQGFLSSSFVHLSSEHQDYRWVTVAELRNLPIAPYLNPLIAVLEGENMLNLEEYKQQAAEKAVEFVQSGMVVGLGTGSTAVYATRKIGELLSTGELSDIIAIPTSEKTAQQARESGVPLTTLAEYPHIDLTIDGADEIDPQLNLIKGLGGALLREKIVAQASKRVIIVADYHKKVHRLGERAPVPVEVIPFAQRPVEDALQQLQAKPVLRLQKDADEPFITDENNVILDCFTGVMEDPIALGQAITNQPGVVEHGLFIDLATDAIVVGPDGLEMWSS